MGKWVNLENNPLPKVSEKSNFEFLPSNLETAFRFFGHQLKIYMYSRRLPSVRCPSLGMCPTIMKHLNIFRYYKKSYAYSARGEHPAHWPVEQVFGHSGSESNLGPKTVTIYYAGYIAVQRIYSFGTLLPISQQKTTIIFRKKTEWFRFRLTHSKINKIENPKYRDLVPDWHSSRHVPKPNALRYAHFPSLLPSLLLFFLPLLAMLPILS